MAHDGVPTRTCASPSRGSDGAFLTRRRPTRNRGRRREAAPHGFGDGDPGRLENEPRVPRDVSRGAATALGPEALARAIRHRRWRAVHARGSRPGVSDRREPGSAKKEREPKRVHRPSVPTTCRPTEASGASSFRFLTFAHGPASGVRRRRASSKRVGSPHEVRPPRPARQVCASCRSS
jgi:hypothetical protein